MQRKHLFHQNIAKTCLIFSVYSTFLTGCAQMPALFSAVEDIETQQAINITVDHEALNQNTDLTITLDVKNKDQVK